MPAPFVELEAVTKRFLADRPPALDAVSLTIVPGRITGLVGPDGAGKTTLLRLIAGLMLPDEGEVRVFGHDTRTEARAVQARIGYMPQRFGLYEDLTVVENLNLYAELRELPFSARAATFERLLSFTGLAPFTRRLAGKLSGGMKQKLGLACVLINAPDLLLLDEPSVGVDPISRRELWRMVGDLARENVAILWSTAYLDEAERCAETILLNDGHVLFAGQPAELTARVAGRAARLTGMSVPRRALLRHALESTDIIDGVIEGTSVRILFGKGAGISGREGLLAQIRALDPGVSLTEATPRFEDAFIDALGGGPKAASALAEAARPVAADTGAVIEADGLTKRFGEFVAAEHISFTVQPGEIFGLLGPNGAGKSTTFRMLCGLLTPSAGTGRIAGIDLTRASAIARGRIGYMAQRFSLYGDLSVTQNLAFFARLYGLNGKAARSRIGLMTETFALGPYLKDSARNLPLGYKQRLALAAAVMHEPDVLFLDEPTSGVDPVTRREFWSHINGLVEKGVAILVTTHFMEEAEYCDRIALIFRGRIIATGTPDELKAHAADAETPEVSLEDAFIRLIERSEIEREAA